MALIAAAIALVVALLATPVAMRVARRTGIVDRPGPLKVQTAPVPYLGGLGVFVGVGAVVAVVHPVLLVPLALAAALGVADDAREVPPVARLAGEIGIGVITAAVAPVRWSGPVGPVLVVIAVVGLVNALNMLDGLDALAGGVTLVGAVGFAIVLRHDDRLVALALAGAVAGFLWFNRPPARVYLGDAGAYLVGTALALLLAMSWHPHRVAAVGVAGLALVALPVLEATVTILRRVRAHHPLFQGDRGHVYDQLVDRGWAAARASGAFAGVEIVLAAVAIGVAHASTAAAGAIAIAAVALLFVAVVAAGFTRPEFRRET
ncbi:MAG TPA: MraY family glycosyltransferase [Acidimicrobiia bacterium]|nr:MraY family glycosyltransferase [Acidimicrobiia bacterium]